MPTRVLSSRRAVFLDRDGTLNAERRYLSRPDDLELLPEVPQALQCLRDAGFRLFIITNQSGIGRGYYSESDLEAVNHRLIEALAPCGIHFEKIYYAPEAPEQPSRGRKPSPQFLYDARDEFGVDLGASYMVGDKLADLECGWNAGVRASILVRTGYGRDVEREHPSALARAWVVDDLAAAARRILEDLDTEIISSPTGRPGPSAGRLRVLGIIPARYASTRFPGKALHLIDGKPLVQHVVERCRRATSLDEIIVATDDARIAKVVEPFARVEMTRADHPSGTDRIAEVAARVECDAVVNIQGDEPLIRPEVIDAVAGALQQAEMSTAASRLRDAADLENPNVVKVVVDVSGRALYFSRRTIPYLRDLSGKAAADQLAAFPFLKHLGIYGYRREVLLGLVAHPVSALEAAERLEQLRALENGITIAVVTVDYEGIGVDVPADAHRVEAILQLRR